MLTKTLVPLITLNYYQNRIEHPIAPPEEVATCHNEKFVMANKLDWTQIFDDPNNLPIPDMTPIPLFTGEREKNSM